jgi:two-component system sensor histidine kinase/response regulator
VNQKVVSALLSKHGYSVSLANNGREALDRLEHDQFDLVLMDIQMPELDGIQAAHRIRRQERWKHLPIIAMTAHAMNGDRERCLDAGMNGYLSKPVSAAHLLDVVREFSSSRESAAQRPPAPGTNLPAPIDRNVASRLMDNDDGLINGMALLFLQLAPERLQRLQSAAIRRETGVLRSHAQKLEKAAERIAAMEVARCAREVANAATLTDYGSIQDRLAALEQEIHRLEVHLRTPQTVEIEANA